MRFRFSLRALMLVALIVGAGSYWYGPVLMEFVRELVEEPVEEPGPYRVHGGII